MFPDLKVTGSEPLLSHSMYGATARRTKFSITCQGAGVARANGHGEDGARAAAAHESHVPGSCSFLRVLTDKCVGRVSCLLFLRVEFTLCSLGIFAL